MIKTSRTKIKTSDRHPSKNLVKSRFLQTLRGETTDRPAIWMMRQAGRYLPEYQKVRSQFTNFMELCQTPEATTELALQPLKRYGFDAAILFSDILTIPYALDMGLNFLPNQGPKIASPIQAPSDVYALPFDEVVEKCDFVYRAVSHLAAELHDTPMLGFAGSPWTLACYMIQGQGASLFPKAKQFAYEHPIATQELIHQLSITTAHYLAEQAKAGADVLFIIDTWGGILDASRYQRYVLEALKIMQHELTHFHGICKPILFYSKGLRLHHQEDLQCIGYQGGLAVDWSHAIGDMQSAFSKHAISGNLDPAILLAGPTTTQYHTQMMLESAQPGSPFIASLGHGILPETPTDSVHAFIDTVKSFYA